MSAELNFKTIPPDAEATVLALINRINRFRPLLDDELDLADAIARRQTRRDRIAGARVKRVWTHAQDAELKEAQRMRGGVRRYAEANGLKAHACWMRLNRLKNVTKTRDGEGGKG